MPAPVTQPERIRPMPSDSTPHIAIIGGGFAGAVTALKLARAAPRPGHHHRRKPPRAGARHRLQHTQPGAPDERAGKELHALSGPARTPGLLAAQPAERDGWRPPAGVAYADSFAPRHLYGDYVQAELENALAQAPHPIAFKHLAGRARDLDGDGAARWAVRLEDGRQLRADYVVLATGLFPRTLHETGLELDPELVRRGAVIDDLWSEPPPKAGAGPRRARHRQQPVGAGRHDPCRQPWLSRRVPQRLAARAAGGAPARCSPGPPSWIRRPLPATLRDLLRAVQAARRDIASAGEDWQRLAGAVRPHLPALWTAASADERLRFIRHLRPYWELGLHRAAPSPTPGCRMRAAPAASAITQAACCACRPPPVAASRSAGARAANRVRRPCWWTAYSTRAASSSTGPASTTRCCAICWARAWPCRTKPVSASPRTRHRRGRATPWPASGTVCRGSSVRGVSWESNAIGEQIAGATATVTALAEQLRSAAETASSVGRNGPGPAGRQGRLTLAQQAVEPERFVLRDARLQARGRQPVTRRTSRPRCDWSAKPAPPASPASRFRRPGDARTCAPSHPRPASTVADRDDSGRSGLDAPLDLPQALASA